MMDWDIASKVATFATPSILLIVVHFIYRSNTIALSVAKSADTSAAAAAAAVRGVEATLAKASGIQTGQLAAIATDAKATHTMVNSDRGLILLSNLVLCKHVERLTEDPEEKALAHEAVLSARRMYEEHQKQQAIVDREKKTS